MRVLLEVLHDMVLLIRVFGLEQLNRFVYFDDLDMSLATISLGTKF